ncbi:nitric oxide reductase activation protein [Rhodobacter maris]|uniref:Nitric oxide reductase activation protein n=2 Tax=Rhodobacter maris TaxID=446682 RepID=A0A285S5B1_9RHOB|nr:nitric oxide reductase activation protein [Rhodobacter maris]
MLSTRPLPPSSDLSGCSSPGPEGLPTEHAGLPYALPAEAAKALAEMLPEARRRLSPRGLDTWLRGVSALAQMGRGPGPIVAYTRALVPVARDLGEELLAETTTACLGFASRTSGAVIARILDTAPLAARRLGDAGLFRAYLRFLEHLLARAPRAIRPMLDHLGEIFDVLTLGGLRRWAESGIEAHRTDPPALEAWFALASEASRAALQAERKGTLLVDVQRRLAMYLRALWGRDFVLVPTAGDFEARAGLRPFAEGQMLHLPDALDDWEGGLDLYRAQVAHLAAHLASLTAPIATDGRSALDLACIGLIEDARAEALAIRRFPNLRALWARFHGATAEGIAGDFDRIARALLTGKAEDALSGWVLERFAALELAPRGGSRDLGLALANRLRGMPFSAHRDLPSCPYRCDNRILWAFEEIDWENLGPAPAQTRRFVSVSEMVNEVEVETAGEDAQEVWVQSAEFFDDDGTSFNAREGKPALAPPVLYEEFDHRLQRLRPAFATLREIRPRLGDPAAAEAILERHRPVTERLRHLMEALRPQGAHRIRKLEDGDEIDLEAAIRALSDLRQGREPDPRVMMRVVRKTRDTAVLVLLDLSESTNDPVAGGETVLSLTQSACLILAQAIDRVGDRFAIHGFQSDGRENVFYTRLKDFDMPWGAGPKARIMGAEGRLSTRMGTALRHATAELARLKAARKLLLVLTDGAPSDIDVRDPHYLRADARAAVEAARRAGVTPFCLTLDPGADAYAGRIFGAAQVQVLEKVERLPERLPGLYAALTR